MNTLASRLTKALKDKQGLTQAGLARACGVKPPSVSDWINGKTKTVEGANLINAAEYLGVRGKWLATGLGPMRLDEQQANEVKEESAQVFALKNRWPFATVSQNTWESLSTQQKITAESIFRAYIDGLKAEQTKKLKSK